MEGRGARALMGGCLYARGLRAIMRARETVTCGCVWLHGVIGQRFRATRGLSGQRHRRDSSGVCWLVSPVLSSINIHLAG